MKQNHPKTSLTFPRQQWGSIGKVLSLNKLSDRPENAFKKIAMEFYLMEFSTNCLMPSD